MAPTSVALASNPEGAPLVGREALHEALQEPEGIVSCPRITCNKKESRMRCETNTSQDPWKIHLWDVKPT